MPEPATSPTGYSTVWGDPCRECGFAWSVSIDDAVAAVVALPADCAQALSGTDGSRRHPELTWSAKAYVFHVGDNLRIFAERLSGIAAGAPTTVAAYDENELAAARGYESLPLQAAQWSLSTSIRDWTSAVSEGRRLGTVFDHPERGHMTIDDIVLGNAHDALHHLWDIRRTMGTTIG